jgi:hypothetical protein
MFHSYLLLPHVRPRNMRLSRSGSDVKKQRGCPLLIRLLDVCVEVSTRVTHPRMLVIEHLT